MHSAFSPASSGYRGNAVGLITNGEDAATRGRSDYPLQLFPRPRAGSTPGSARSGGGGGGGFGYDNTMVGYVRKQMENVEEKLSMQLMRGQERSDKLQTVTLTRLDSKIVSLESAQPKMDRRLAELSGNYKGLSEEMQTQIRRIDRVDSQIWEWRHQLEEEIRGKLAEMEQNYQRVASMVQVAQTAQEEINKLTDSRLLEVEEQMASHEGGTNENLEFLHQRLENIEQQQSDEFVVVDRDFSMPQSAVVDNGPATFDLVHLEGRLADVIKKCDLVVSEMQELHTKIEIQEVCVKTNRTRVEENEKQTRGLSERVGQSDWNVRLQAAENRISEIDQCRIRQDESIGVLEGKITENDQSYENLADSMRCVMERMAVNGLSSYSPMRNMVPDVLAPMGAGVEMVSQEQLKECMNEVQSEIEVLRADAELAPRVSTLVSQLKDVAPKVIDQEKCVREVLERLGSLEVEWNMGKTRDIGVIDSLKTRMHRLEVEVHATQANLLVENMQSDNIAETE